MKSEIVPPPQVTLCQILELLNNSLNSWQPSPPQVTLYHILKLFQSSPGTTAAFTTQVIAAGAGTESRKILVAEAYDELVFQVRFFWTCFRSNHP